MSSSAVNNSGQNSTFIESIKTNEQQSLYFGFQGGNGSGNYTCDHFEFYPTYVGAVSYSLMSSTFTIVITEYGNVNEYVKGRFSGNVYQNGNSSRPIPVQGTFRVKRYS